MTVTPGRAQRPAAIAFGVLLLATAAAFLFANKLKSAPAAIDVIRRNLFFSPDGDGRRDREPILFTLDQEATAAVDIVDADGVRVRRLEDDVGLRPGRRERVAWDGRDDDGRRAPDGEYRMRLILGEGRSLLAPRSFFLDTTAPRPTVTVGDGGPTIVSPGTAVAFTHRGEDEVALAPRFRVLRTDVSPPRAVRTIAGEPGRTDYEWDGNTDAGLAAAQGTYLIAVTAYDRAQNEATSPSLPLGSGPVPGSAGITVRDVAAQPPVRSVRAGDPVNVRVDARGRAFDWALRRLGEGERLLSGRRAAGKTNVLLRAPSGASGIFTLEIETLGASTRVPIAVRSRADNDLLVVLPMITWLGRAPVDQSGDGVPDVFGSGGLVRFPRPFVFPTGLPPGLTSDVAPLLATLDELDVDYDLATDVDLAFDAPLTDGQGVLFAPGAQWTTRPLAKRLRDFVAAGGRVATFGPAALTGTVTVADAVLSRPTPTTNVDAFGGRLGAVQDLEPGTPLTVSADDPALGLLEGFSGRLDGFSAVEELEATGGGELRAGVGEESIDLQPALSAVAPGEGLVVRVGLPEWGERLAAGSGAVEQITANVFDVLRGVQPRVRTTRG